MINNCLRFLHQHVATKADAHFMHWPLGSGLAIIRGWEFMHLHASTKADVHLISWLYWLYDN